MNRREFCMTAGGATALSVLGGSITSLLAREGASGTTPFYMKGLAMVSFGEPEYLTIALPEAPHHTATLQITTAGGATEAHAIRGHGALAGSPAGRPKPEVRIPSLVDVQELYPGARSRLDKSPTIIRIPWPAVAGIAAETFSEDRWTFVIKETGEEIITFRPRKVAESLRIDLVSSGVLEMNDGKIPVDLASVTEVATEFIPTSHDMGGYTDHFALYLPYVEIAEHAPEIEPKQLGVPRTQSPMPTMGHSFAATRMYPWSICYPFRVG